MIRRHEEYTPEERAAYLAMFLASGRSQRGFARDKGIPLGTLHGWIAGSADAGETIRTQEKARLEELYDAEIRGIMDALPGKRDGASYRDLAIAAGIFDDKVTRSRGDPTERVEHVVELDLSRAD